MLSLVNHRVWKSIGLPRVSTATGKDVLSRSQPQGNLQTVSHVVTEPNPPESLAGGTLKLYQVPAWNDNFVWLIVSEQAKEAAVVDGPEATQALTVCKQLGVQLTTILNTHTHGDHIGINRELLEVAPASLRVIGSKLAAKDIPGLTHPVSEGDHFDLFGTTVEVWLTEGHMNGHVSYLIQDALFCGDTLFAGGCGYIFDGPPDKMHNSLSRFSKLNESTRIYCAHEYTEDNLRFAWSIEPNNTALSQRIKATWAKRKLGQATVPSSIGLELKTNPFLRTDSEIIRQSVQAAFPDRTLDSSLAIFTATRELKNLKKYKSLTDKDLPL